MIWPVGHPRYGEPKAPADPELEAVCAAVFKYAMRGAEDWDDIDQRTRDRALELARKARQRVRDNPEEPA